MWWEKDLEIYIYVYTYINIRVILRFQTKQTDIMPSDRSFWRAVWGSSTHPKRDDVMKLILAVQKYFTRENLFPVTEHLPERLVQCWLLTSLCSDGKLDFPHSCPHELTRASPARRTEITLEAVLTAFSNWVNNWRKIDQENHLTSSFMSPWSSWHSDHKSN